MSRDRQVRRVLVLILFANLFVTLAELAYGLFSGSRAFLADGFHSLVDAGNNVLALAIATAAAAPPDEGHPYGHRKFEVIGSLLIGGMILLMVIEVGREAIRSLLGAADPPNLGPEAYVVLGATLVANAFITIIEHRAARKWASPLLAADAKHTLADIFVKLGVVGGVVGVQLGAPRADGIVALAVLAFIGFIGFGIVRRAVRVLTDHTVIPKEDLRAIVLGVDGVVSVQQIRSRGMEGDAQVDLIIHVASTLTVEKAHEIADEVEAVILERWGGVSDVVVHVEPARKDETRR